ncbi:hypothetical protein ILYODFUR_036532 [Ilyodon furcidens]|uniref:Uncharacterized protein n=1 Tax=Ilyodon furcidens TaxID=33524 RepID=A0ABV0UM01_9TELE
MTDWVRRVFFVAAKRFTAKVGKFVNKTTLINAFNRSGLSGRLSRRNPFAVCQSHVGGTAVEDSGQMRPNMNLLNPHERDDVWQQTLYITLNTTSPPCNMVITASCCGDAFLQQGHGQSG